MASNVIQEGKQHEIRGWDRIPKKNVQEKKAGELHRELVNNDQKAFKDVLSSNVFKGCSPVKDEDMHHSQNRSS